MCLLVVEDYDYDVIVGKKGSALFPPIEYLSAILRYVFDIAR